MPTYTIQSASQKKHFPKKGNYDAANVVSLTLVDEQGKTFEAEWMQRGVSDDPTTAAGEVPAAGSKAEFDLSEGQYGLEAKKPGKGGGGGNWGGGRSAQRNPRETASIVRQHSQHMAILWAQGSAQVPTLDELKPIIDWFATDAQEASAKVKDTRPATGPTRNFLSEIMDGSGAVKYGIRKPTGVEVKAALTAVGLPPTGGFGEKLLQWQASSMIDAFQVNRVEKGAFSNGDKGPTLDPDHASDILDDGADLAAPAPAVRETDDIPF